MAFNILVPDEWLRDYLETSATPKKIAEWLSLCGPSVEKVENSVYSIEVTTNRVDAASIYGIAREASVILPRFGVSASLHSIKLPSLKLSGKVKYLSAEVDRDLCSRFTAVLIKNVKIASSPDWMKQRLEAVKVRPLNNVVDISNYIMHELGQPVHTFDYDKIQNSQMILRASKKGERITTLDAKTHTLNGGDIVIEDGGGRLIDLAGIMGGQNSAVDANTNNVLLFVQTYNPVNIRKTSMSLAHRTEAAILFEKGLDPELVTLGISRGIGLFSKLTGGNPEDETLDIYPKPYFPKTIKTDINFICHRLGVEISKGEVVDILKSLGFESKWKFDNLDVVVPSFRAGDLLIPEDIVEEVARIYGYHKLPSRLMEGTIPEPSQDAPFPFEQKIKNLLSGWGAIEFYSLSLVPEDWVYSEVALRLKNPLGRDSEYLRMSLAPSLIKAASDNLGNKESFHLFEMANVYIPKRGDLPQEKMMLAGIFFKTEFREAKGIVEALLQSLNIEADFLQNEQAHFAPSKYLEIKCGGKTTGELGVLENENLIYWELDMRILQKVSRQSKGFTPIPKFPPQVEDITLSLPERTKAGAVLKTIRNSNPLVSYAKLTDVFKNSYTFRVHYQHPNKTLTNEEVVGVRERILNIIKQSYGGIVKD
jgi:phenylalanyl-tRNA synthetase beta chain